MVLATDRADVNRVVRKHLGVRKISFADQALAELTGMQQGGITPIGLPGGWPTSSTGPWPRPVQWSSAPGSGRQAARRRSRPGAAAGR